MHSVTHQLPAGVWQEQARTLTSFLFSAVGDKAYVLSRIREVFLWGWQCLNGFVTRCVTYILPLYHLKALTFFFLDQLLTMSEGIPIGHTLYMFWLFHMRDFFFSHLFSLVSSGRYLLRKRWCHLLFVHWSGFSNFWIWRKLVDCLVTVNQM